MENRSLVTIAEHSREKILYMLEMAKEFEAHPNRHILDGKVVATLFFEPSTVHASVSRLPPTGLEHVSSGSATLRPPAHPRAKR